jgi:hypothetical protein
MAKLIEWKLELYPSVVELITAQEKLINDLAICGIAVDDEWKKFYILSNPVFRSGQIDRPVIYRFVDRSDAVIILQAALGLDGLGFIWQISNVFAESIYIYAKGDI